MSGLPIEIQCDGRQLNENGEIAGEFPNGNGRVLLGKRREPGGQLYGTKAKAIDCIQSKRLQIRREHHCGILHMDCRPLDRQVTSSN